MTSARPRARKPAPPRRDTPQTPRRASATLPDPPTWLAVALLLVATLAAHAPALGAFFAQDDFTFLARARGLVPDPWTPLRFLSVGLRWRVMNGLFGLDPFPYHAVSLALHALNTLLMWRIGRRLLGRGYAALAAGLVFGVSSIAFTPLWWASGMPDLLVTTFALAALGVHLARPRGAPWLTGALALAAMLSKETALPLPLALWAASRWSGATPARARALAPAAVAALAFLGAVALTLARGGHLGGEAYAMTASPAFLAGNLATYLAWIVQPFEPLRDAVAAMDPRAWLPGGLVAFAIAFVVWLERRDARRPATIGAAWLVLFLLPVLPLAHHTYLYYLYLPWAGGAWLVAAAGQRALRRAGGAGTVVATVLLLGLIGAEHHSAIHRPRRLTGDFPTDPVVRDGRMLRNALATLDSVSLPPGSAVGFVNPAPQRDFSLVQGGGSGHRYIPLEAALRGNEVIGVFHPGVTTLGFHRTVPPGWERAELFLYRTDGRLRALGHGGPALAQVGWSALTFRQWAQADSLFRRSRVAGDTLPDATFGLVITSIQLGRPLDGWTFGHEFLARWPADERAAAVREQIGIGARR